MSRIKYWPHIPPQIINKKWSTNRIRKELISKWYAVSGELCNMSGSCIGITTEMMIRCKFKKEFLKLANRYSDDYLDLEQLPRDAVLHGIGRGGGFRFLYHNSKKHIAFTIDYMLGTGSAPSMFKRLWKQIRNQRFRRYKPINGWIV